MREASGQNVIPTLDGWRAIAILMVIFCHASRSMNLHAGAGSSTFQKIILWCGATSGPLGVSVFFGISGYLICTRLLRQERTAGRISLWEFYRRRAFRILPAAFLYLAVVLSIAAFGYIRVGQHEVLSCSLFFRNYWPE